MTPNFKSNKLYPCLLLDNKAFEAANFYIETFGQGSILMNIAQFTLFEMGGYEFKIINTNHPDHKSNPAISFMVAFDSEEELEKIWKRLKIGGIVLMPLDKQDWSSKYGWVQDQFGISWQLILSKTEASSYQKISPILFFGGSNHGRCELASNFYLEVFKNSHRDEILRYQDPKHNKLVRHSSIYLEDYLIRMIDSTIEQPFDFSAGISFTIECESQKEIDYYWNALSFGGEIGPAGWVKDKFGISWQIIPKELNEWILNPAINLKIVAQLRLMQKIDLEKLKSIT